jgi:hypothetical protein
MLSRLHMLEQDARLCRLAQGRKRCQNARGAEKKKEEENVPWKPPGLAALATAAALRFADD